MRSLPDGVEVDAVIAALREGWDFDTDVVEYAAVGAGSYHWHVVDIDGVRGFVTVDDLGQKAWLGDTRDAAFAGLHAAFDTAASLRDAGLRFVVAPTRTRDGEPVRRLDSRYAIALFPSVDGVPGEWGRYGSDADRLGVIALLAELHQAASVSGTRTAGFELPGRHHLEAALLECDEAWTGGPLSEPARAAVAAGATELAELIALADRLAADAASRERCWVVTHGEPHPGNVMRTSERQMLVDWDTVALAPPERDLWMLADEGEDAADLYIRLTGTELDPAALDYFKLTWDLKDFAEYLNVLRAPHDESEDTVRQCRSLENIAAIRETWSALLPG